jgi:hypothetical protein
MSKSKNKKKSSQMVLRVEKHEKDQFLDICKALDTSAARELRRFMREFVAANQPAPKAEAEEPTTVIEEPVVAAPPETEVAVLADKETKPKKKAAKR